MTASFFLPITEFFILIITFGFGIFIKKYVLNITSEIINYSEISIYGFCFILPLSHLLNFFFPLSHDLFWIFFFISFIYIINQYLNYKNIKKWLLRLTFIFLILTPIKLVVKGHEDIWYHLPKVLFLNNYNIIFGIANYSKELAYSSGWSYINAFFNFFNGADKNLYLISYVFIILCIDAIYQNIKNQTELSLKIFGYFIISFLGIKFYRLQEFGNDYQGMILILLVFYYYFAFLNDKNLQNKQFLFKKIIFFSVFAFFFKIHGILVLILALIFIFKKFNIFKKEFLALYFFLTISLTVTSITSFVNSGCLLFPIEKTCFKNNNFSWSVDNKKLVDFNLYLRSFNKSYELYLEKFEKKKTMTKEEWVNNFNWLSFHLMTEQFYTGFLKTIIVLLILFLISYKFIRIKFKKLQNDNLRFICLSFLVLVIWIIQIPVLRAGGFAYLSGFLIFFYCSFIDNGSIEKFKSIFKYSIIFLIIFTVMMNINRISKEFKSFNTNNFFYFTNQYNAYNDKYSSDYFYNFLKDSKNLIKKNNYIFLLNKP